MFVDGFEQLVVDRFRFGVVARAEGFGRAMAEVIFHEGAGDAAEGFLDGGDLGDDVGAVAILFDHLLEAADLAFDAAEAIEVGFFDLRFDFDGFSSGDGHRRYTPWAYRTIPPGAMSTARGCVAG